MISVGVGDVHGYWDEQDVFMSGERVESTAEGRRLRKPLDQNLFGKVCQIRAVKGQSVNASLVSPENAAC